MKSMIAIAFCICMLPTLGRAQDPSNPPPLIVEPERFDQWGDIRLKDENARLENVAIKAKEWPLSIIYLVIHAGKTACIDEAKARGFRAKNYLMRRGVPSDRIKVIDAGWRKEASVQVWIWPPELSQPKVPNDFNLKPSEVKLEKNCKIKYRRMKS
jgi:hypothetical protein